MTADSCLCIAEIRFDDHKEKLMQFLLYTMKDGTRICASRPERDGSFFIIIEREISKAYIQLKRSGVDLELVGTDGFEEHEIALLYHFVGRRIEKYEIRVKEREQIEKMIERISGNFLLLDSEQALAQKVAEKVQENIEENDDFLVQYKSVISDLADNKDPYDVRNAILKTYSEDEYHAALKKVSDEITSLSV